MLLSLIPLFIIECLPLILATIIYELRIIYFIFFNKQDRPISPRYSFDCVAFLPWKVPEETKTWQGNFISWSCGIIWFLSEFTLDLVLIALGKSIEDGSTIRGSVGAKEKDSYIDIQLQRQREEFSRFKSETMDDDVEALAVENSENIHDEEDVVVGVLATIKEEEEEEEKILVACETIEEDVAVEMTPYTEEEAAEKDLVTKEMMMEDVIVDMTTTTEVEGVTVEIMKDDAAEMAATAKEGVIVNEDEQQSIGTLSEQPSVQLEGNRNSDHCSDLTFVIDGEQTEAVSHSNTESGSKHDLKIAPEKGVEEECQYQPQDQACHDTPQVESTVYLSSDNYSSDSEVESEGSTDGSEGCTCHDDSDICSKEIATMTPDQSDSISLTQIETPIHIESSTPANMFLTWSERKTFSSADEPIVDDLVAFASLIRQNMPRRYVDPITSPGIAAKIYREAALANIEYTDYNSDHSSEYPVAESNSPIDESNFSVAESNSPVAESNFPVAELNSPIAESNFPVTESNFPVTESNFPVAESNSFAAESNFPVAESNDSNTSTTAENTAPTATVAATTTTTTTQKKKKKKNKKKNQAKRQEQSQDSDAYEIDEMDGQGLDANTPMSMSSKEANQSLKRLMETPSSGLDMSIMSTIAACSLDGKFTELGSVAALTKENGDLGNFYLDALTRTPWERKPSREPVCAK